MAMYAGVCDKEQMEHICDLIYRKNADLDSRVTLSYAVYKYDVLLQMHGEYDRYVFDEIGEKWGNMLFQGATSFWEDEEGEAAFNGAGSLCHGWSATPLYLYFRYVLGVKAEHISGKQNYTAGNTSAFCKYKGSFTSKGKVYHIENV